MAFFFPCEFSFGVFVLGELFLISVLYCIVIPLLRFILCTVVRFDKVWRSWMVFCVVKWVLFQELLPYAVRSPLSLPQFGFFFSLKGWRLEMPLATWQVGRNGLCSRLTLE